MQLAPEAHGRLQEFFRAHYEDTALVLPVIEWHTGAGARWVTRTFAINAITFGARVLVDQSALRCDEDGRWWIRSRLAAHEATHVLQYRRQGWGRFLYGYLNNYADEMRRAERWNAAAHFQSYEAIRAEREAQELEAEYVRWSGRYEEELV